MDKKMKKSTIDSKTTYDTYPTYPTATNKLLWIWCHIRQYLWLSLPRKVLAFIYFFAPSRVFIILALLSRSLPVEAVVVVALKIRGHIAGPPPASPLRTVRAFIFVAII